MTRISDPKHPLWMIIGLIVIAGWNLGVMMINASNPDKTEVISWAQQMVIVLPVLVAAWAKITKDAEQKQQLQQEKAESQREAGRLQEALTESSSRITTEHE